MFAVCVVSSVLVSRVTSLFVELFSAASASKAIGVIATVAARRKTVPVDRVGRRSVEDRECSCVRENQMVAQNRK